MDDIGDILDRIGGNWEDVRHWIAVGQPIKQRVPGRTSAILKIMYTQNKTAEEAQWIYMQTNYGNEDGKLRHIPRRHERNN